LPYIEQQNLFNATYSQPEPNDRNGGQPTYSQWLVPGTARVKSYICPSDPTQNPSLGPRSSYGVNGQLFRHNYNWGGVGLSRYPASISDGTSNTIFYTDKLAESNSGNYPDNYWPDWGPIMSSSDEGDPTGTGYGPQFSPRMSGTQAVANGGLSSSAHSATIIVGLGDGSVRNVAQGISTTTWWFALTPAGGEVLGSDW